MVRKILSSERTKPIAGRERTECERTRSQSRNRHHDTFAGKVLFMQVLFGDKFHSTGYSKNGTRQTAYHTVSAAPA